MIVSGTKTIPIATENIYDKCPHCGTQNSVQLTVLQKYFHVFWIPFVPYGKTGTTQCAHCKQTLEKKEFSEQLKSQYETLKQNSRTPAWTFSGLVILAVLVIWGIIYGHRNDEKNAHLVSSPQKGDVYEIKNGYKQYTLHKVDSVAGDTVFILESDYQTDRVTGLLELKKKGDGAYVQVQLPFLKTELKSKLEKGEIIDIDRKEQPAVN